MGRALAFLADALAALRAAMELRDAVGRSARSRAADRRGAARDAPAPAPVELPEMERAPGVPLRESGGQGRAEGLGHGR